MEWIDTKYVSMLSNRLERFSRKDGNMFNFRCPVCGDSQKNKRKARGYIYPNKGNLVFHCHNCSVTWGMKKFIKYVDPELYKEYVTELFKEDSNKLPQENTFVKNTDFKPKFITATPLKNLKKISQLEWNHPAKEYILKRMIPNPYHAKLFYCPKFNAWVNSFIPNKFSDKIPDEPRLIIPFLDKDKNLFGFQGRSFSKTGIRYITIMIEETAPKIFGLDTADLSDKVYVVEGPIDSMFIPNCIAMAGSSSIRTNLTPHKTVMVYDNEPRNKDIVKLIDKSIDLGYNVCLWPSHIVQKDINEMVVAGMSPIDIRLIIDTNTFKGLNAKLKLQSWKRC